jgi:hypothetical protein
MGDSLARLVPSIGKGRCLLMFFFLGDRIRFRAICP